MSKFVHLVAPAALLLALCLPAHPQTTPSSDAAPPSTLFSDLEGTEIHDGRGGRVASLEDVIVDETGRIIEVVLGEGGLFGIGRKLHLLDAGQLPELGRTPIAAANLSAEDVAALPIYDADNPPDAIGPAVAPRAPTTGGGASSSMPTAPGAGAPADNARASGTTSVEREASSAGSGSGGMAPQQGTGTGATQVRPDANENAASGSDGNPTVTPEQARLNAEYGRDKQPDGRPMPDASGSATTVADTAGSTPRSASGRWHLAAFLGATVKGKQEGIEIEDFRIEGQRVVEVVLSRSIDERSEDLRAVSFDALIIAGDRDDPDVALGPGAVGRAPLGVSR